MFVGASSRNAPTMASCTSGNGARGASSAAAGAGAGGTVTRASLGGGAMGATPSAAMNAAGSMRSAVAMSASVVRDTADQGKRDCTAAGTRAAPPARQSLITRRAVRPMSSTRTLPFFSVSRPVSSVAT